MVTSIKQYRIYEIVLGIRAYDKEKWRKPTIFVILAFEHETVCDTDPYVLRTYTI